MKKFKVLLLPGDGIGPEVATALEKLLAWYESKQIVKFDLTKEVVGGACYDVHNVAITRETLELARQSDAILFGAVGGEKWRDVDFEERPEAGILKLRKELQLYANVRPAYCFPALVNNSSLKPEVINGLDLVIVRESTAGAYFGEPKDIRMVGGQEVARDNQIYTETEIERVARVAFDLARTRKNKVTSVEKHNVMMTGILWKKIVTRVQQTEYPDVKLEHMLTDNCAMQLVRNPKQFDVIVTDNLFGDILSDEAAMLTGSLGMLPSASLGPVDHSTKTRPALYEPVHGSAPDIAGKNIANPLAMIGSFSMALKFSFGMLDEHNRLNLAINRILEKGARTADIAAAGENKVGTIQMVDALIAELEASHVS